MKFLKKLYKHVDKKIIGIIKIPQLLSQTLITFTANDSSTYNYFIITKKNYLISQVLGFQIIT